MLKEQMEKGRKKNSYLTINRGNEPFKYKNILDWDKKEWKYQKEHKTLLPKKYKNVYFPGEFFRAIETNFLGKEEVIDGLIISSTFYIYKEIELLFYRKLDLLIPTITVIPEGKSFLEKSEDSNNYIMEGELRCAGLCKERKKIIRSFMSQYVYLIDYINRNTKEIESYSFRKETEESFDIDNFIIGGKKVAKKIRLKTFLKDFKENQQSIILLENIAKIIFKEKVKGLIKL